MLRRPASRLLVALVLSAARGVNVVTERVHGTPDRFEASLEQVSATC